MHVLKLKWYFVDSDLEEEEAASESGDDSDNSWTTPEEFSAEFILKQGSKCVHYYFCSIWISVVWKQKMSEVT